MPAMSVSHSGSVVTYAEATYHDDVQAIASSTDSSNRSLPWYVYLRQAHDADEPEMLEAH